MTKFSVTYSTIDGFRKTQSFKTLAGASKFAKKWVGEAPDLGGYYAVSFDGVGKVTCSGCTLQELFYGPALAAIGGYSIQAEWDGHEALYRVYAGTRSLAAYDTYPEALEHVGTARQNDQDLAAFEKEDMPF